MTSRLQNGKSLDLPQTYSTMHLGFTPTVCTSLLGVEYITPPPAHSSSSGALLCVASGWVSMERWILDPEQKNCHSGGGSTWAADEPRKHLAPYTPLPPLLWTP